MKEYEIFLFDGEQLKLTLLAWRISGAIGELYKNNMR